MKLTMINYYWDILVKLIKIKKLLKIITKAEDAGYIMPQ